MKRFAVAGTGLLLGLAGCTFLVSFDDMPTDDAGFTLPDSRPPSDVAVSDTGPDVFEPFDDSGIPDSSVDYTAACTGKPDGKYCNGNMIVVDAGSKDDLITCLNGKTVTVKLCTNRCTRMPSGYPDECDQCQGKATGLYCGDDFTGWHPANAKTRIRCDNNAIVGNLICTNQCVGTGPGASCQ